MFAYVCINMIQHICSLGDGEWPDVGGLVSHIDTLKQSVMLPILYPVLFNVMVVLLFY